MAVCVYGGTITSMVDVTNSMVPSPGNIAAITECWYANRMTAYVSVCLKK